MQFFALSMLPEPLKNWWCNSMLCVIFTWMQLPVVAQQTVRLIFASVHSVACTLLNFMRAIFTYTSFHSCDSGDGNDSYLFAIRDILSSQARWVWIPNSKSIFLLTSAVPHPHHIQLDAQKTLIFFSTLLLTCRILCSAIGLCYAIRQE